MKKKIFLFFALVAIVFNSYAIAPGTPMPDRKQGQSFWCWFWQLCS